MIRKLEYSRNQVITNEQKKVQKNAKWTLNGTGIQLR